MLLLKILGTGIPAPSRRIGRTRCACGGRPCSPPGVDSWTKGVAEGGANLLDGIYPPPGFEESELQRTKVRAPEGGI